MSTITIPKAEYTILKKQAKAYKDIASRFAFSIIETPVSSVVENFRKTGKYSKEFINDLEDGLSDLRKSKSWKSK